MFGIKLSLGVALLLLLQQSCKAQSEVEYYTNLISQGLADATSFVPPTDASQYKPKSSAKPIEDGTYDFIIVGAGTAGSVIANRLVTANFKVLLLEAGTFKTDLIDIPRYFYVHNLSKFGWNFHTTKQTTACLGTVNQTCQVPRGRGLGGSSLVNGVIYSRGHKTDFNKWGKLVNDSRWGYSNVLNYFKKSEHFIQSNPDYPIDLEYHGTKGPWQITQRVPTYELSKLFLRANSELGFNLTDNNSPSQLGGSAFQLNIKNGQRLDLGTAYILPILNNSNLVLSLESYVTEVELSANRIATGVVFTRNGTIYRARARKEIILSAGSINTPQILMLSGIGPKEVLTAHNITVKKALPVGKTLYEHPSFYGLIFSSNITKPNQTLADQIKDFLNGTGSLTSPFTSQAMGFYQSSQEKVAGSPDLELLCDITSKSDLAVKFAGWKNSTYQAIYGNNTNAIVLSLILLHPKSYGNVTLKSNNPYDYPLINYNMFSDKNNTDLAAMYDGIKLVFKMANTSAFQSIGATFRGSPLPECSNHTFRSKAYWYCALRQTTLTTYHPVGTCPMGTSSKTAVVNADLEVFGISKLRVADASVFPSPTAGHSNAPTVMVAERVSDIIKNKYSQ